MCAAPSGRIVGRVHTSSRQSETRRGRGVKKHLGGFAAGYNAGPVTMPPPLGNLERMPICSDHRHKHPTHPTGVVGDRS
ncbi:hypothetical protein CEP51_016890, partial [Fusarium floridanum]